MGTGSKGEVERWNSFLTQAELFVFCNSCFFYYSLVVVFLTVHQIALLKGGNTFSVPEERRRTIQQFIFLQVFCMEFMNKTQNDLYLNASHFL